MGGIMAPRKVVAMSVVNKRGSIGVNHPLRGALASLSTGSVREGFHVANRGRRSPHYEEFSHWWGECDSLLRGEGLMCYNPLETPYSGDGRYRMPILEIDGGEYPPTVGYLIVHWHRQPPHWRWEITCYLS
jgi:hypothetical protein